MQHRGEETDLGTSRSLTRLPFVPRNTVGRGERSLVLLPVALCYLSCVICYLLFWLFLFGVTSANRFMFFGICFLVLVNCYVVSVICYVLCGHYYWFFVLLYLLSVTSSIVALCLILCVLLLVLYYSFSVIGYLLFDI